ncbi:hypothetical protein BDW74DRAFT_144311 [Aspergillus multicolor]|uniref:uncharacterized protein n=1 Tax=Aspergillus multicolor TaxID=41759 RepID=UPI003CCCEBD5
MAYDGYQPGLNPYGQPDNTNPITASEKRPSSFEPPYPYQPASDHLKMPQPQVPPPHSAPPQGYYPEPSREQTSWPPPPPPQAGRINEAVTSAVGNSAPSSYVSPDLVAQITANVIQQLGAAGINSPVSHQPPSQPPPPQWASSQPYQVPSAPHTPIIPHGTPPPTMAFQPPPPSLQPEYPSAPHLPSRLSPTPPQERERRESPASQYSDNGQKADSRPKALERNDTFPTTLEKIWGKLFDNGKPTERLGQFLRGIAMYLIEYYPPGNTLVVVPDKLQKFYADTNVASDPYPWQDIFDDRTSSISRLFRDFRVEHHLVQLRLDERPDVPALTPKGFELFATLMIQAHPDKEYERLQKAVLNMPISNPDNKKERFPKEIPRRLFPETPDLSLRKELEEALKLHCGIDLPDITDEEIRKAAAQRAKSSTTSGVAVEESNPPTIEREKKPYVPPTSAVIDDEDEEQSPPAIERKRKPYTAQPGGGKVYDGPDSPKHRHASSFSTSSGIREARPSATRVPDSPPHHTRSRVHSRSRAGTSGRSRSQSRFRSGHEYRHSETDLLNGSRTSGATSSGDYYYNPPTSSTIPSDLLDQYRDLDRSAEDHRLYEQIREREKEREKSKYHESLPSRSTWSGDDDDYRGLLGGQGGGSSMYDYKRYR